MNGADIMKDYRKEIEEIVSEKYGENAKYIMKAISDDLDYIGWKIKLGRDDDAIQYEMEHVLAMADRINNTKLTPVTAKVGDGATVHFWSDSHAGTIIKVTKSTITVQRDKATLDPDFKPEFIPGGFCAHCTNQEEQKYTYERDPKGELYTFHWSNKYNSYGQPGDLMATSGRREFYDYNF